MAEFSEMGERFPFNSHITPIYRKVQLMWISLSFIIWLLVLQHEAGSHNHRLLTGEGPHRLTNKWGDMLTANGHNQSFILWGPYACKTCKTSVYRHIHQYPNCFSKLKGCWPHFLSVIPQLWRGTSDNPPWNNPTCPSKLQQCLCST